MPKNKISLAGSPKEGIQSVLDVDELRESEEKFRALFYTNHAILLLIDPETEDIVDANPAAFTFYGWSKEEFLQKKVSDLNILNDEEIKQEMQNALTEKRNYFEFRHRLANGEIRDVQVFSGPIQDKGKTFLYSIVHDITSRKQAEKELQRQRRILELFIEYTPAAIAMFDTNMRYIACSQRYLLDYDLHVDSIVGKSHYDVFPEIPQRWKDIHNRCLAGAIEKCDEDPFPRVNGKIDWVRWEIHPWYENDEKIGGIVLMSEVITDHVLSKERIKMQIQRLKTLRAIDLTIISSFNMKSVLTVLLESVINSLKVDAAAILLHNPITNTLECNAEQGFSTQRNNALDVPLGETLPGRIAIDRKPMYLYDLPVLEKQLSRYWLVTEEGFITYFGIPLMVKGILKGVLEVFHRSPIQPDDEWLDFLDALAGQAAIAIENIQINDGLRRANLSLSLAYDATIEGWSQAMDLRDKETEGHTRRVADLTVQIMQAFGMSDTEIVNARRGALLHDIGKLGVPDNVLLKPGALTEDEWKIMRQHPQYAYNMLAPIDYLNPALDIPYCHHEKWDGSGYPQGIAGEQIPFAARIFAIIDVWDALNSDRPYRPAWPREKIITYIRDQSGKHFDPQVVDVFLRVISEME